MGHCRHEIKCGPSLPFLPPPPPAALWPFSSSSKKESYQPCITPSNGERKAKNCTHPPSVLSSSSLPLLLHESCKKAAMALALLTLKLTTLKGKEGRSPPEQCKPSRTRAGSELTFPPSPPHHRLLRDTGQCLGTGSDYLNGRDWVGSATSESPPGQRPGMPLNPLQCTRPTATTESDSAHTSTAVQRDEAR